MANHNWIILIIGLISFNIVDQLFLRPRRLRKGALKTINNLKQVYCGAHEYREVRPTEFPQLDQEFYRQTQDQLEKLGFRQLADIEDVTLSRSNPNMRSFIRVMLGNNGTIMSGHYDARCRGFLRLIQLVGFVPRDMRIIDLETEFTDGTFICTSTATFAGRMNHPPEVNIRYLPTGTPASQLLDEHRRRVADNLREHPDLEPRCFSDYDQVCAAQNRLNEIKSRYRAGIGYLAPGEIERIASPGLEDQAAAVAEEIEKIKQREIENRK